jgi:hypothetical protein
MSKAALDVPCPKPSRPRFSAVRHHYVLVQTCKRFQSREIEDKDWGLITTKLRCLSSICRKKESLYSQGQQVVARD